MASDKTVTGRAVSDMASGTYNGAISAGLIMPHNLEAEQGLLGAMMLEPKAVEAVSEILQPGHFYAPAHQRIATAIFNLTDRGLPATPGALYNQFEQDSDLNEVGGPGYLADLCSSVVSIVNAKHYAEIIIENAIRREIITTCNQSAANAQRFDTDLDARAISEDLEEKLYRLSERGEVSKGPRGMADGVHSALDMIGRAQRGDMVGITTGIKALDTHMNGLQRSDLILVGGRPSMGKTALGLTLAYNAAQAGHSVLFFSLEMSVEQLMLRLIARVSEIPMQVQMRPGAMKNDYFEKVNHGIRELRDKKLFVDDRSALSVAAMRTTARRHKRQHGLDMIVIDYLGLMTPPSLYTDKVNQLAEITKGLKSLAKDLDVPIILLHQLSRAAEGRENKRPQLADLRDSGAIEQDADIVIFPYREEYYLDREEPSKKASETNEAYHARYAQWQDTLTAVRGKADLILAKFRQGEVGKVSVAFSGIRQCFYDLDND